MSSAPEFDVIVIGGGINGLTTAAYLAKTGLSTVVVERREEVGTHCVTEEHSVPGFRISPHATSQWVGHSPCMADLELEKFGLELIAPRYTRAMPFADGKAFVPDVYDANNLYKKWLKFSEKDAKIFKDLMNALAGVRVDLYMNFFYSAPSPENWDFAMRIFSNLPHVPEDFWDMTGFGLADYLFESDYIKAQVTAFSNAVGFPPHHKIIGPMGTILMATSTTNQQAIGGAHQVPHALQRCIVHHGGKILQSCEVEKIIVEDGEAKGVVLSEHSAYPEKKLMARKAVISDLTPVPTFIDLVGEEHLDPVHVRMIKCYDYEWHVLFTACYMTTEPPKWKGASFDPDVLKAWNFNIGAASMEDVERAIMDLLCDRIPKPITALGSDFVLTLYDKTAAPKGYHNVQLWADVPYSIRKLGGPEKWDDIKDEVLDEMTETMEDYAPGFKRTVKYKVAVSPLDIYRKNPSAIKGPWNAGISKPGQLYFDRPFLGCNAPRTPIKKLYLSNGMWPWSMSWLASGYIAACEVIKDLGIERPSWWSHKCFDWYREWAERNNIPINLRVR